MLSLKNITKDYRVGTNTVKALRGVSIDFRKNEFVSILGQSGCGKTTLLNIIGGLDQYTDGDLVINGKSTKDFKDKDWDTYRNHSIGFVFQSYNLIAHQTVLSNVELALTLTGVSKSERKKRAIEALEKVGLGDQLNKKPNQMSGGQMQRVAIARALVNNPDILLADEPTGALDSETSVQIMELLKEVSKDRLVIMVTHNPELAENYSTRIINLLDGVVTNDSMPYVDESVKAPKKAPRKKKEKNTSMSFLTALGLSFNNLKTKKARTFLVSFAGSIGIIGIALILSLSNGIQAYIQGVQQEALTSYPLSIMDETNDMSSMMSAFIDMNTEEPNTLDNETKSNNIMTDVLDAMVGGTTENNLEAFKKYIESDKCNIEEYVSDITYEYSTTMHIYRANTKNGLKQVNPATLYSDLGFNTSPTSEQSVVSFGQGQMGETNVWTQLSDNDEALNTSFTVEKGRLPEKRNEVVIILDKNGEISDYTLYSLGLMDQDKLIKNLKKSVEGKKTEKIKEQVFSYDKLMNQKYKLLINTDYYSKNDDGTWEDHTEDNPYIINKLKDALKLKVVGVVKSADSNTTVSQYGGVGYRTDLTRYLVNQVNESEIVKWQKENKNTDVFSGIDFPDDDEEDEPITIDDVYEYIGTLDMASQQQYTAYIQQMQMGGMSDEEIAKAFGDQIKKSTTTENTYEGNLEILGVADLDSPSEINIYPIDFESKDNIEEIIKDYNDDVKEADKISYTDYIGLMMKSVTTMINAISYVLIGFVSISLIVSSIMIGIITYISVLERTKEIGILRAIGARKRDISRVFNAETMIIGFVSGLLGIIVTLVLNIPINIVVEAMTDVPDVAVLPWIAGIVLVIISMVLTFVAGLVPAKIAARKDPVIALRNE